MGVCTYLFGGETFHVGGLKEVFQILAEICDIGVHRDLGEGGMETKFGTHNIIFTQLHPLATPLITLFSHSNSAH